MADIEASTAGGLTAHVLGHSGMISISSSAQSHSPSLTINFKSINEYDITNSTIQAQGHSFNSFASQDFSFSPIDSTTFGGVAATHFNFSATL